MNGMIWVPGARNNSTKKIPIADIPKENTCGVFLTGKLKNGSTGMKDAVPGSILNAIPGIKNMTDGSGERRMAEPDLAGFNYPEQKLKC